jgi:hypothetical protein
VLSELYAALTPLRKVAAQPNASPGTLTLLREIQSLLQENGKRTTHTWTG